MMGNPFLSYEDLRDAVAPDDFEERPVDLETFVQSRKYLGLPPLSDNQYTMIKAATQIYKRETLHELYGFEGGEKRWAQTCNEVIYKLGKGSGKDYCSTIACAYVVHLLLCLKDPAGYYGRTPGDTIDIINVAVNAAQANNVFFKGFVTRIDRSPWFEGRWTKKVGQVDFDKNITVYSGHSEREAFEGYNVIFVVLDEISGFAIDSTSGNEQAKTAQAIYDMYRASVDSRFPDFGKLMLLSFPRYKGCFISQRYDAVVAEKETIVRNHTFKIDPDLPDGTDGNEFDIEWEEDHIVSYAYPKVFALCRPTWDINPLRTIEDFKIAFLNNIIDALARFACMPPEAIDAFFKDKQKIQAAFAGINGVDEEDWSFRDSFMPKDSDTQYYLHVDLARKQDHCAVAMAHVDGWRMRKVGAAETEALPVVRVDVVRWWTPTKDKNVDFDDVRDFIVSLRQRGFNIMLVTFDRWESSDMIEYLNKVGIKADTLSVAKKHYGDFSIVMHGDRLIGPDIELLRKELLQLRIMPNDKVDHPRKGSKDLSDAVCGAIYNSVEHTPRDYTQEVEISTYDSVKEVEPNVLPENERPGERITAPKRVPASIEEYLRSIELV